MPSPARRQRDRVARARLELEGDGGRLEDVKVIFRQPGPGRLHALRLAAGLSADGGLFVTLGERGRRDKAQDLGAH